MPLAVGVDLGGTNIRAALIAQDGTCIDRMKCATRPAGRKTNITSRIADLVQKLVRRNPGQTPHIAGVGIGLPGTIDAATGIITQSPNIPEWVDYPLREKLSALIPFPLVIENDANAAALGELTFGAGSGMRNIICLTLGTGVGGGVIVDGEVLHGTDGMAGELGHITVFPNGPPCNCGNQGCLEALASATAIRRMVLQFIGKGYGNDEFFGLDIQAMARDESNSHTARLVADAARAGDPCAIRIYRRVGTALGVAAASLVNIFNPQAVIIGGGVAGAWELFITDLKTELRKRSLKTPGKRVKILRAGLGDDFGVLGASSLILRE